MKRTITYFSLLKNSQVYRCLRELFDHSINKHTKLACQWQKLETTFIIKAGNVDHSPEKLESHPHRKKDHGRASLARIEVCVNVQSARRRQDARNVHSTWVWQVAWRIPWKSPTTLANAGKSFTAPTCAIARVVFPSRFSLPPCFTTYLLFCDVERPARNRHVPPRRKGGREVVAHRR